MNKTPETALVPFHGHQLLTIKDGDTIRVAMKPICEAIGLDWKGQYNRIQRHPVMAEGMVVMTIPSLGGNQETTTLPLDYLNGWLFGIDTNRVKPEIRDLLIDYQRECFTVLSAYWQQGIATNPRARAATVPQLLATQRQVLSLMRELKRETYPAVRHTLHAQLEQSCRLLDIPVPELDQIGADVIPDHESPLLAEFWEIVDLLLQAPNAKLNHARGHGVIAINLPQIRSAATSVRLKLPEIGELRRLLKASKSPQFIDIKAVNSRHGGATVKCWVFSIDAVTTL